MFLTSWGLSDQGFISVVRSVGKGLLDTKMCLLSCLNSRDVLQSTVAALRGALMNSLQLSAVVNSVLGSQQHHSVDALPEDLMASQPPAGK